jgi:hypothetical protein
MPNGYAFENLWHLLTNPQIDWADPKFDMKKAYVMSLFSALAYEHLSKYEIDHQRRAKVIPCLAYQEHLGTRSTVNIAALKRRLEGFEVELIETEYAVYVIIKVRDLIVIAVRGTIPIYYYDLRADLNIRKVPFGNGNRRGFFHKGFYDEVVATGPQLLAVLVKLGAFPESPDPAPKIYITGHSLGGAIAAILYGLWVRDDKGDWLRPPFNIRPSDEYICHSAYTFGMPKFANTEIVQSFRRLFHVRNQHDPVPYLPPGFAYDKTQEIILGPSGHTQTDPIKALAIVLWLNSFARLRMLKNHGIETYWTKLAGEIGADVPDRLMPPDPSLFQLIPFTHPHRP